jgi:hypothetical protein
MGAETAMEAEQRTGLAQSLMQRFGDRTGLARPILSDAGRARRYLWTDAFAVCNFLELHRRTAADEHLLRAHTLVDRVHEVLGRHRPDDERAGWISGLPEEEGRAHPTRGGLRIGKPLPERRRDEPFDERGEWDRDGQYFHYLTRWMHALARMAAVTGETHRLEQAVELAVAAHAAFVYQRHTAGRRLMYWKTSIDLRRPLVPAMGQHDPLDGLLVYRELRAAADTARLDAMIADFREIAAAIDPGSEDPLGLGGLLCGAYALAQLRARGDRDPEDTALLQRMLESAAAGVARLRASAALALPARHRLAFRELGLAIGLHAVPRLRALWERDRARLGGAAIAGSLDDLGRHADLAAAIEDEWSDPRHRDAPAWNAHVDIDEVMLATALMPDGYLTV